MAVGSVICILAAAMCASPVEAQTLDTLTFANPASETSHKLVTGFPAVTPAAMVTAGGGIQPTDPSLTKPSDTVAGGLGLQARRLLPRGPNPDVYGGDATFTMIVDPMKQNYFTIKLWGSDTSVNQWFVLECNGFEVGARHGEDKGDLLWSQGVSWFSNRFIYRTRALPLNLTRGQTSVIIRIRSLGWLSYYDSGAFFNHYNKMMNSPSLGLYSAYTHTGSFFDASSETQGVGPTPMTPVMAPTDTTAIANLEAGVDSKVTSLLKALPGSLSTDNVDFLAQAYGTSWSIAKNNPAVVNQVIGGIDGLVTAYSAAPTTYMNGSWGGLFGGMGDAIRLLWPQINAGSTMSTMVNYGGSLGTISRTQGWSAALRASVDSGRYNRRTITNQEVTCASGIYGANQGLLLVQPSNALFESEALRYLYEASGLSPWLGNDQTGAGPTPIRNPNPPYGPNWFMITSKGTTKEDAFVGSDYGEMGGAIYRMGVQSNDASLKVQGVKVYRSRDYFRFPAADGNGYLIMQGAEPIGIRNNGLPGHYVYLGRGTADDFLTASQGAAVVGSDLLGYFQQGLNDGQIWPVVAQTSYGSSQQPLIPDFYAAIKAQPQTGVVLPQTAGAPDFAWADEENMVVSAKHGTGANEERFFANLLWHDPSDINGMAKIFDITPAQAILAEIQVEDVRFKNSGITTFDTYAIEQWGGDTPPDNPQSAYGGLPYLEAIRPDLVSLPPTNQDGGRGTGYTLRYGHWLVGINADPAQSYTMLMPSDFQSGRDLISNQTFSGPVTLSAKTSAVFYLAGTSDPSPPPARVMYLQAGGGNAQVALTWTDAAAASSYIVKRSTTPGGPYIPIAIGVTPHEYADPTVTNGNTYYYVVDSVNAAGLTGGDSPEASARPAAPETASLPPPWIDADVGSVGVAGSASLNNGTFTVNGSGSDIYNTADSFHYVFQPAPLGNGVSIAVRVMSQQNTSKNAKAGVMFRASLDPGSPYADVVLSPLNGVAFIRRTSQGGGSSYVSSLAGIPAPYWLRLSLAGGNFVGEISSDGAAWTTLGTTSFDMGTGVVYIGMADTATANTVLNTTVFDNVSLTGVASDSVVAVPTGLSATAGAGQISLSWNSVPAATAYNLKRSTVTGGPYTPIASNMTSTTYMDSSVVAGAAYYYVVSSLNQTGESPNSAQVTSTIVPLPATISVQAAPSSSQAGTPVQFTATLSPTAATGTVTFNDGGNPLGKGTIINGLATFTTAALGAGSHIVTVTYGGDSRYVSATSAPLTVTVKAVSLPATISVQAVPLSSQAGTPVQFNATLSPTAATGTVTFNDGGNPLGTGTITNGLATFTTAALGAGSHIVSVTYSGDFEYAAAISATLTFTVTATTSTADFSLTSGATSVPLVSGASAVVPFILTASGGFNQPVAFSCSVPLVQVTCAFPSPILMPMSGGTSTSVTVQYPAGVAELSRPKDKSHDSSTVLSAVGLFLAGLGCRRRRSLSGFNRGSVDLLLLLTVSTLTMISGCGVAVVAPEAMVTTHTLTITGTSGQIAHTTSVALVVTR